MFDLNDRFTAVEMQLKADDPDHSFENSKKPETRLDALFKKRSQLSLGDIVERIKQRISFFSIFKMHDRLDKYKALHLEGEDEFHN